MDAYVRDGYGAFRQPKFECGCCERLFFRVSGVRENLYLSSRSRNPDLDDQIFDCLPIASMVAVQAEDVRASFLFLGDLNGHRHEWLGSTTKNSHEVASFDFATVSSCDQLVVGPTRARAGTLDLLMTDVPDLVRVPVVAPIGNSDHSSLSAVISMAQAVINLCVSRKVFQKYQVCSAIRDLPWSNIWFADNLVEVLNEHLSRLVGRFVPTKVIRVRIKDKPWFAYQYRHAFGLKQDAHLWWTRDRSRVNCEEFVRCQVRANETYSEAMFEYNDSRDVLMHDIPLISGGPLLSLRCSVRVRHCLRSLVRVLV